MAGSIDGAPSTWTDAGPPLKMIPRDRRADELVAQPLDVLDRDALIGRPEQAEPRRLQRGHVVDQRGELREAGVDDAAAVEPHRGTQRTVGGDEERHAPAHAEPDDPD